MLRGLAVTSRAKRAALLKRRRNAETARSVRVAASERGLALHPDKTMCAASGRS